jgi:hypothetical protein
MRTSNVIAYALALVLGLGAGYVNLQVNDPTLAALLAAMIAMGLGLWKHRRPWRWGLLVGLCIPAAQILSYMRGVPPLRGEVTRACFIGLVSAMVAAYLGGVGRIAFENIRRPPESREPAAGNREPNSQTKKDS